MPKRGLTESFNNAIEGLTHAVKTQRNLRLHLSAGVGVLALSVVLGVGRTEFLVLLLTISFVITAEMLNTAVELMIDLTKDHFHPIARAAKDVAAGAVFIAALSAFTVGCFVFADRLKHILGGTLHQAKLVPWHVTFFSLGIVILLVIVTKLLLHRGTPLLGGMPSGHAAFAFSLWTLAALLQSNLLVTALVFVLAFVVAKHRVDAGVHSFWESVAGATVGALVTFLVIKVFGV